MSYHDPTIPKKRRPARNTPTNGPTWGWFVDRGAVEGVILRDMHGNTYNLEWVNIQHGGWGFGVDGFERLPRPAQYDANGKELVQGDRVAIHFIDGSPRRLIVTPGFRSVTADEFLAYNHKAPGANPNRLRARVVALGDGGVSGDVKLRVCDNSNGTGTVAVNTTDTVSVSVGTDDPDKPSVTLQITNSDIALLFPPSGGSGSGGEPIPQIVGDKEGLIVNPSGDVSNLLYVLKDGGFLDDLTNFAGGDEDAWNDASTTFTDMAAAFTALAAIPALAAAAAVCTAAATALTHAALGATSAAVNAGVVKTNAAKPPSLNTYRAKALQTE